MDGMCEKFRAQIVGTALLLAGGFVFAAAQDADHW
jgi:hypothetical protein